MNCLAKRLFVFLLYSIIHGSAVLGVDRIQRCITKVHLLFDKGETNQEFDDEHISRQHFVHAFQHYNWQYFYHPINNYIASGYFENLLKILERTQSHYNFTPPSLFCAGIKVSDKLLCYEALYKLFADKFLSRNDELARIITEMSGYQAFKHVYRNIIYSKITFNNVYPQQQNKPTLALYEGDIEQYKSALEIWIEEDGKKKTIFSKLVNYYL